MDAGDPEAARAALQHVGSSTGLRATFDPARGAKILSLVDGDGVEWLATTDRDPASLGSTFGEAEMAGWDECAPTITACSVDGVELPDHGDLWDAAWDATDDGVAVSGASWPYRIERAITAAPSGGLRLDYVVRNLSDRPLPFLWAAHPQFAAPPGTRIEITPFPAVLVDVLDDRWPRRAAHEVPLTIDDVPRPGARKVYVAPEETATGARIIRADGSQLRLAWSPECRYLGLWFDHGAYSDQPVVAIEPSTGFADSLEIAHHAGTVAVIPPLGELRWWVAVDHDPAP